MIHGSGDGARELGEFLARNDSIVVLSGAGVSTGSGIPDYRDHNGDWKHAEPMQFGEFRAKADARRRYWARSFVGWQRFSRARPNAAHEALAQLEAGGKLTALITQNVDGLHSEAGSRNVIDLHGRLENVRCIDCGGVLKRSLFQQMMRQANPGWHAEVFRHRPDGDAELADKSHESFSVPGCPDCGGTLKPDVVMFGESVPKERLQRALAAFDSARALLVVGSSLMVYSGFRFARRASDAGKPIAIVNRGRTRADDIAALKVAEDCAAVIPAALQTVTD